LKQLTHGEKYLPFTVSTLCWANCRKFICTSILIKRECYMFKTTDKWEWLTPFPIFLIEIFYSFTLLLFSFHANYCQYQIKLLYIFLYSVNATIRILNNYSLWIRYSSLGTKCYFWLGTFVIKKSHQWPQLHTNHYFHAIHTI